jgi:hypothetical protein
VRGSRGEMIATKGNEPVPLSVFWWNLTAGVSAETSASENVLYTILLTTHSPNVPTNDITNAPPSAHLNPSIFK